MTATRNRTEEGVLSRRNIFVVGLDPFNREKLENLPQADEVSFHPALGVEDIREVERFDMAALIDKAVAALDDFQGEVHGVVSYWDFPGSAIAAILTERFALPGPSLQAVLKCEHKYWSRLEQQKVVPAHIPRFQAFDPFDDEAWSRLELVPPFWIKPFKSFRSFLAFNIHQGREFRRAQGVIREHEGFLGEPFRYVLEHYDVPESIAGMDESFIAESGVGGAQCTLEGYVYQGDVRIYGVVDSVRQPNSSSFSRYEYPSSLPLEAQQRMMDVARRVVTRMGLDNTCFNIEFFYDQSADQVWLLEINPRLSQAHGDLFEKVHGFSHYRVMVDLALGRRPHIMERTGEFSLAAHFMMRVEQDGRVRRVPDEDAIARLKERVPGLRVKIVVKPGQRLSELQGQDMYSYELANVFVGGRDQDDVLEKYDLALAALQFDIDTEA